MPANPKLLPPIDSWIIRTLWVVANSCSISAWPLLAPEA
jgi:hypothetical protein